MRGGAEGKTCGAGEKRRSGSFDGLTLAATGTDEDAGGWKARLPPDMKRAGQEIHAPFRASWARGAEWLNFAIPLARRGDGFFSVPLQSSCPGGIHREGCEGLSGSSLGLDSNVRSDTAEVALRRLASYVHDKRTRDRDAAVSLLA